MITTNEELQMLQRVFSHRQLCFSMAGSGLGAQIILNLRVVEFCKLVQEGTAFICIVCANSLFRTQYLTLGSPLQSGMQP
jgi:hypothetical protein